MDGTQARRHARLLRGAALIGFGLAGGLTVGSARLASAGTSPALLATVSGLLLLGGAGAIVVTGRRATTANRS